MTFAPLLLHQSATFWQDNNAILHALLKGGSKAPEVNAVIGRAWLTSAELDCAIRIGRVESRCNVADSVSRNDLGWVTVLQAEFVEPVVPDWLLNPWMDPLCTNEGPLGL